jgi:integrase
VVAYYSGWRKNEILSLEWSRIDFKHGTRRLDPNTTKNGRGRTFPCGELVPLAVVDSPAPRSRSVPLRQRPAPVRPVGVCAG